MIYMSELKGDIFIKNKIEYLIIIKNENIREVKAILEPIEPLLF